MSAGVVALEEGDANGRLRVEKIKRARSSSSRGSVFLRAEDDIVVCVGVYVREIEGERERPERDQRE